MNNKPTNISEIDETILEYEEMLDILERYDENDLEIKYESEIDNLVTLEYEEALTIINRIIETVMKKKGILNLFGVEREKELKGILGNIAQTFDGVPIYNSNEERAAHLLYFIIKQEPFCDGNKRIACILFLIYLRKASIYSRRINKDGMTPISLMIAESNPNQKDTMINLVLNLLQEELY